MATVFVCINFSVIVYFLYYLTFSLKISVSILTYTNYYAKQTKRTDQEKLETYLDLDLLKI